MVGHRHRGDLDLGMEDLEGFRVVKVDLDLVGLEIVVQHHRHLVVHHPVVRLRLVVHPVHLVLIQVNSVVLEVVVVTTTEVPLLQVHLA